MVLRSPTAARAGFSALGQREILAKLACHAGTGALRADAGRCLVPAIRCSYQVLSLRNQNRIQKQASGHDNEGRMARGRPPTSNALFLLPMLATPSFPECL